MVELIAKMKSEGIEIINHTTRELTPEELFYLRKNILEQQARNLKKAAGTYFKNVNSHNELKINGNVDELILN